MLPRGFKPGDEIALPSDQGSGAGFVPDASLRAVQCHASYDCLVMLIVFAANNRGSFHDQASRHGDGRPPQSSLHSIPSRRFML